VVPLFVAVFEDTVGNEPRRREERQEKPEKAFAGFVSSRFKSSILRLHSIGRLPAFGNPGIKPQMNLGLSQGEGRDKR
jgi:hypothetical protein